MARNPEVTDSATTQFFINLADAPALDHVDDPKNYGYCVFGTVVEGMDVAERISQASTQDRGGDLFQSPQEPVIIESVDVM
jgi:cyclophilin family peptidyl-prolyl cis-trans isomerase